MPWEWDAAKNAQNIRIRGLSFARVAELTDVDVLPDERRAYGEVRYVVRGFLAGRLHIAIITPRGTDTLRVISFRRANARERKRYVEAIRPRR